MSIHLIPITESWNHEKRTKLGEILKAILKLLQLVCTIWSCFICQGKQHKDKMLSNLWTQNITLFICLMFNFCRSALTLVGWYLLRLWSNLQRDPQNLSGPLVYALPFTFCHLFLGQRGEDSRNNPFLFLGNTGRWGGWPSFCVICLQLGNLVEWC